MTAKTPYLLFIFLLFAIPGSLAQNITGTWEGRLGRLQFLQINVIQVADTLCGYTWDHLSLNKNDYCKAYFTGSYDKQNHRWRLKGTSFIETSGDHTLMELSFIQEIVRGKPRLWGRLVEENEDQLDLINFLLNVQTISLKKIADTPTMILNNMKDCLLAKQKSDSLKNFKADRMIVKKIPNSETDPGKIKTIKAPVIVRSDSIKLVQQMTGRKNIETTHLEVNERSITLYVYDNALVDGDTVSIFYNGKLILSHQALKEDPILIPIMLEENTTKHEITLFAENLGSIPPNTALVVVHAGEKRYELYASASLTENAVITFEYKPK